MGEQFQRVNALQVTDHQAIKGHSAAQTERKNFGGMISYWDCFSFFFFYWKFSRLLLCLHDAKAWFMLLRHDEALVTLVLQ